MTIVLRINFMGAACKDIVFRVVNIALDMKICSLTVKQRSYCFVFDQC